MADASEEPKLIARYTWHLDEGFDGEICDEVCIDRLIGAEIIRYDAADPASHHPAYGGWSKNEYLLRKGLDPDASITIEQSAVPVSAREPHDYALIQARKLQREKEEAEAKDIFDILSDEAAAFDFDEYQKGEEEILAPALQRRGFTSISFYMIEQDSFGPLIRGCRAKDPSGDTVRFYYG